MNITKEQADKVIAALEIAKATLIEYGDWWPVGEPIAIVDCAEALSIMRGLADAEAVNRCITELLAFAKDHPGTYIFPSWDGSRVMKYLATSPQAAQTALKSESSAQAAQAPARLPGEGKTIEALALTEAQEREAFEAWASNDGAWTRAIERDGADYKLMQTSSNWRVWKAARARAGSKP